MTDQPPTKTNKPTFPIWLIPTPTGFRIMTDQPPTKTNKPTFPIWLIFTPTGFRIKHRVGTTIHTLTTEKINEPGDENQKALTACSKGLDWLHASLGVAGWPKSRFELILVCRSPDIVKVVKAGNARSVILSRIIKTIRAEVARYSAWRIEATNER